MSNEPERVLQLSETDGMQFACVINGDGSATPIGWPEVEAWSDGDAGFWVHLNKDAPRVRSWIVERSGLSKVTTEALLAPESRPRAFHGKFGFVTILRGVNTNPGAEEEDMVALRIWSDGKRLITLWDEKLKTPLDILSRLMDTHTGPHDIGELYERLIARLTERIGLTVEALEGDLDSIEVRMETESSPELRREVSDMRRKLSDLRRYIAPQREALGSFLAHPPDWFDDASKQRLRESADRTVNYIEEIDSAREQAMVLKDEISNQLAESTNRTLYVLAVISGIFLPFGFVTGLFGINVGGMPGTENASAFLVFCGILIALLIAEIAIFKRLKWF
jgi:zinc transporter